MTTSITARAETAIIIFRDLRQNRTAPWISETRTKSAKTEAAWATLPLTRSLRIWSSTFNSSYWTPSRVKASISDQAWTICRWLRQVILLLEILPTVSLKTINNIRLFKDHCRTAKRDQLTTWNTITMLEMSGTSKRTNPYNNSITSLWIDKKVS